MEERCQELLGQWLERGSVALKPAGTSWEKLLKAMKEAQCSAVAQELQVALSGKGNSLLTWRVLLPHNMSHLSTVIKVWVYAFVISYLLIIALSVFIIHNYKII